jgi:PHD/YefM family antitoxin component YafN of YafNO toxin-antitoxin module
MDSTSPKKLRAELKDYLDLASKEPIRIQRRAGDSFVLLAESRYAEMQLEIMSLQRRLLSSSHALEGKTKEFETNVESRLKRMKKRA